MIPPFLPPVLPGQPQGGQGKGANPLGQGGLPDFAAWLQPAPQPQPLRPQAQPADPAEPAANPNSRQTPVRDPLGPLQTVEAPHPPHLDHLPPRGEPFPHEPRSPVLHEHTLPIEAAVAVHRDPRFGAVGEHLDFVEIPWRLQANAGLSYIGAGRVPVAGATRVPTPAIASALPGAGAQSLRASPELAHFSCAARPDNDAAEANASAAAAREVEGGGAAPTERLHTRFAPLLSWPDRLLRWLEDHKGTTAWVRDFRFDPAKLGALVDSLRCMAAEQGLSLHRIMLNGRELWRADTSST